MTQPISLSGALPWITVNPTQQLIAEILGAQYRTSVAVGSRVTCNPAPVDTDEDWLVLTRGDAVLALLDAGFGQDGSPQFYTGNDNGGFRSWRRGDLNLITTESSEFYDKFCTASDLAKRFNLLDKSDRIALFQAVLYGVHWRNLQQADGGAA